MAKNESLSTKKLARLLGFWGLVIYGVGDVLGAGIYALFGKVVSIGKEDSWIAFTLAFGVAFLTACSYAELGSRHPKSGGAASFCLAAFKIPLISIVIGWMVLWSGMVSMATISQAFSMQVNAIWLSGVPLSVIVIGFLSVLSFINFWGIRYTSWANAVCTTIELSGLFIMIYAALNFIGSDPASYLQASHEIDWSSLFLAGGIAFFALTGFEDMANIAEEVKRPERTLPRAIITAISFAGLIYIIIAYLAVKVVSPETLGASDTPLLDIVKKGLPYFPLQLFTLIALFAMANTALLNFVMGSRLLYGMSNEKLLPAFLGRVHKTRKTPYMAIAAIFCMVVPMAILFDLVQLAATTSALILIIFTAVHLALIVIKRRKDPHDAFEIPLIFPILGVASTVFLFFHLPVESLIGALLIAVLGAGVAGIYHKATT